MHAILSITAVCALTFAVPDVQAMAKPVAHTTHMDTVVTVSEWLGTSGSIRWTVTERGKSHEYTTEKPVLDLTLSADRPHIVTVRADLFTEDGGFMSRTTHVRAGGDENTPADAYYPPTTAPTVVTEEVIAPVDPWNNGAGPTWDYGSRNIVRNGGDVYVSFSKPDPESTPYHNVYWNLYRRSADGTWGIIADAGEKREREPSPIGLLPGKRLALSTTPAIGVTHRSAEGNETTRNDPQLLFFDLANPASPPDTVRPAWDRDVEATEHSYRAFASDGNTGALFVTQHTRDELFNTHSQVYAYRNPEGEWDAAGILRFPLRGCYAAIAVDNRAVHVVAISDEIEPNAEWREYKRKVTGQRWDYEFRQLFYTWTPDVTGRPFSPTLTIDSADETAGHISHNDVWTAPDGTAYVIYIVRNVWHSFMRDRYWPDMPLTSQLKLAIIKDGRVVGRQILASATEVMDAPGDGIVYDSAVPSWANLHATPDGRLFAIWHQGGSGDDAGMFLQRVYPEEPGVGPVRIPAEFPMRRFFNAAERAGSPPSHTVDLLGHSVEGERIMRYLQLRIE